MSARETLGQASAATAAFAGPVLAAAEASGVMSNASRPFIVYALSAVLTLVGAMFTVLMWFIKREHTAITGGIDSLKKSLTDHTVTVTAMSINIERGFAEMRGEVSRRMLIEEHGRSSARLHEKLNRLGRTIAFLAGKLGLPPEDSSSVMPPRSSEDDTDV